MTTARNGRFWFPALPPGTYEVRVDREGFRPDAKSVVVSLDATETVSFQLEPALRESVVVVGEEPLIDVTSTTGGTTYTSAAIAKLPVGRNYADIVRSNPAVDTDRGETQGRALALTIYGATSAENQWTIDGVNTTSVLKGLQGKAINNEFIQEVEVKAGGYQAEYGGALGGVVNVITKSGGNAFHGDGFVYYDSSSTSADQVFTEQDSVLEQMRIADYDRADYGAALGGFLLRDRLWFFAAYDRIDQSADLSRVTSTPLVSSHDRFPLHSADNLYSGKLTWSPAGPTSLVATVFADPSDSSGAAGADPRQGRGSLRFENPVIVNPDPSTWESDRIIGGTDYGLRWTQIVGSSALFTLQGSHHQDRNTLTAADTIRYIDLTCEGGTPEKPCAVPAVPNLVSGGYGTIDGPLDHNTASRDQIQGDVTLEAGRHQLKLGGVYQSGRGAATFHYTGEQEVTIQNEFGQNYYRHSYSAVSAVDLTPAGDIQLRAKEHDLGLYLQDSWKISAGLTLDLGIRWDQEHIDDYSGAPTIPLTNEWQPRVGIVWDPTRDGRTKLYGFAGRFYYALPIFGTAFTSSNFTLVYTYNLDPTSLAQSGDVINHPTPIVFPGGGPTGETRDQHLKGTYQDEYTIGAERLLDPTLVVGVAATYRRLSNVVEDRCDFDSSRPETNNSRCALINPGSDGQFADGDVPVCNGFLDNPEAYQCADRGPAAPPVRRLYRGIEIRARKTVGDTLWLQASYVYSSLRGNYDGGVNEVFQTTTPGVNADFDYPSLWHAAYGRLFLDRPHRFRFDGSWVTPLRLTLGLQAFAESGAPLDQTGYFNVIYGSAVYLVPRGSAGRLPTLWDANLTVSYPILLGPATLTLQAFVFNLFNNQIPTSRENRWTVGPAEGYPDSLFDPSQEPHNTEYGKFTSRETPRVFRAAVRISF